MRKKLKLLGDKKILYFLKLDRVFENFLMLEANHLPKKYGKLTILDENVCLKPITDNEQLEKVLTREKNKRKA